jgi:site-specific DNA recombinase
VIFKQAAIYLRVSTDEQVSEGYSISAQKERLEAFAKSQGWAVTEYYIEEGQSAKDMNRPELQRLLTDVKAGGMDIVLVYRLDRLTRSVLDLYRLLNLFEENKVAFRSATEVYDTTTAMGRLFITLVAALAQWERENLAERTRMGLLEMARQGKRPGTKEPYGYSLVDGQLIINPAEAAIVRKIYDMYSRGYGVRKIIAWLNNPAAPVPSKGGIAWYDSTVSYILTNPLYIGKFTYGRDQAELRKTRNNLRAVPEGNVYQGSHEPILNEGLWHTVQNTFKIKKLMPPRHAASSYPLTGILFCGSCGGNMGGGLFIHGKSKLKYYKCATREHKQTCAMKYFRCEEIEGRVIEYIEGMEELKKSAGANVEKGNSPVNSEEKEKLIGELKEIKGKRKKWYDAYEDGTIDRADLKERVKSISDRETYLKGRLAEIEAEEEIPAWTEKERLDKINNFRWLWNEATAEEKKALAHELIKKITITPEGLILLDLFC